ncbi:hypothetical protein [Sterolibacterium denitrificans]|uniref:hypothetical protein n=1 Tax=Sterolibacterium denitrificans TaxID=157592 RepID=UPI0012B69FAC|nr:hypothetical protein [Sterolibacterium denitrificans]
MLSFLPPASVAENIANSSKNGQNRPFENLGQRVIWRAYTIRTPCLYRAPGNGNMAVAQAHPATWPPGRQVTDHNSTEHHQKKGEAHGNR